MFDVYYEEDDEWRSYSMIKLNEVDRRTKWTQSLLGSFLFTLLIGGVWNVKVN